MPGWDEIPFEVRSITEQNIKLVTLALNDIERRLEGASKLLRMVESNVGKDL
jgi:hypothetical protein